MDSPRPTKHNIDRWRKDIETIRKVASTKRVRAWAWHHKDFTSSYLPMCKGVIMGVSPAGAERGCETAKEALAIGREWVHHAREILKILEVGNGVD